MYKKTIATKIRAKLSWWTKISMLAMLVMYYFGPGTHHIGIMAAKLPFGNFDQKNCPSFSEPIFFFETAKRAALFDGEIASASCAPNSE